MTGNALYVGPFLHLRALPAFADLTPAQLRELAYEAQEVLLPRGTELLTAGEAADAMHVVVDGTVQVSDRALGPGEVVGFLEVLSTAPVVESAVAAANVVALRIETDVLRDICEQNFAVLDALLRHVASELVDDRAGALLRAIAAQGVPELREEGVLDRVQRIVALHRVPMFSGPHVDALGELAGHVEVRRVAEGPLWVVGEQLSEFFLIASGTVALSTPRPEAPTLLGPGAAPGLVEMLAGRPVEHRVVATGPTLLLRIGAEPFMDVIEDHFEMAFGLLGWLAGHLLESPRRDPRRGSG